MKKKIKVKIRKAVMKEQPKLWQIGRYLGIATGISYWFTSLWVLIMSQVVSVNYDITVLGSFSWLFAGLTGYMLARVFYRAGYVEKETEVEIDVPE